MFSLLVANETMRKMGIHGLGACQGHYNGKMTEVAPPRFTDNVEDRYSDGYLDRAVLKYLPYNFVIAFENSKSPGIIFAKYML